MRYSQWLLRKEQQEQTAYLQQIPEQLSSAQTQPADPVAQTPTEDQAPADQPPEEQSQEQQPTEEQEPQPSPYEQAIADGATDPQTRGLLRRELANKQQLGVQPQ